MVDRAPEERRRTAAHESGHGAASYLLRHRVDVVSIRPAERFNGIVIHAPMRSLEDQDRELVGFGPTVLQPARLRSSFEARAMIALAGPAAAFRYSERLEGYVPTDPDEVEVARAVEEFVAPSARELRHLKEAEEGEPFDSDEEQAAMWSRALAGEAGTAYLQFLRVQTDIFVRGVTFGKLMDALVPLLLRDEIVSGRAVRRLFDEVTGRNQPPMEIAASTR